MNYGEIADMNYNLNPNIYQQVDIEEVEGYEYRMLGDMFKDVPTKTTVPLKNRVDGPFRFFSCSKTESSHSKYHYEGTYLIRGSRGTIGESIFCTNNEKFSLCTSMFLSKLIDKKVNIRYVYDYLLLNPQIVQIV